MALLVKAASCFAWLARTVRMIAPHITCIRLTTPRVRKEALPNLSLTKSNYYYYYYWTLISVCLELKLDDFFSNRILKKFLSTKIFLLHI